MSAPRVLLVGYYGFGNAGDEAILEVLVGGLRAADAEVAITVASDDPAATAARHDVAAVSWKDLSALLDAIDAADVVVLGGGGLFHDYWGADADAVLTATHGGVAYWAGVALAARMAGVPLVWHAVGVGPLFTADGRRLTAAAAEGAAAISVRDPASAALLADLGVHTPVTVGADPAFALVADLDAGAKVISGLGLDTPTVAVAMREWEPWHAGDAWKDELAAGLDAHAAATGASVLFVPFQRLEGSYTDDVAAARSVAERMTSPATVLDDDLAPAVVAGVLGSCAAVVAMRLHALVFAATTGVPVVALAYDDKVAAVADMLGLGAATLPLSFAAASLEDALAAARPPDETAVAAVQSGATHAFDAVLATRRDPAAPNRSRDFASEVGYRHVRAIEEATRELARLTEEVRLRDATIGALGHQLTLAERRAADRQRSISVLAKEVADLRSTVGGIESSSGWRLLQRVWKVRSAAVPQGSARERALRAAVGALRPAKHAEGPPSHAADVAPAMDVDTTALEGSRADAYPLDVPLLSPLPEPTAARIMQSHDDAPAAAYDIVCFSVIDWEFRYQRPQQLLSRFAARGHRVFYVSASRHLPAAARPRFAVRPLQDNVYEVQLASHGAFDGYAGPPAAANADLFRHAIGDLREVHHLHDAVAFVEMASWRPVVEQLRQELGWKVVYDCIDDWANYPLIGAALLREEALLAEAADLVVVSSRQLQEKWQTEAKRMLLARNAADFEFFSSACQDNGLLPDISHPVIGYYGAITGWFDVDLVEHAARSHPDWRFVLIGGVVDVDVRGLEALPNVQLLGEQPYELLPLYLFHYDVCTIPFKVNNVTQATDPVKLYEYLSVGKPVVTMTMAELRDHADYVTMASTPDEFVAALESAVAEPLDAPVRERRVEVARANAWDARVDDITAAVEELRPPASIVIITYNNLAMTKLCLESVRRNTSYPNYEVVVVDNASSDGTPEFLERWAESDPHVRVILNDSNRGFAAANNQGLEVARGDYLVLLNNDTVVPRGWLGSLVAHLADASIGLVGPVSNSVGNEAKIPVDYRTWAEMEDFVRRHTRLHAGATFEIHMLAMMCVAMRRDTFERVGPLDEQFGVGMFEDDDYSHRMKLAGYRVVCAEDTFVHHFGMASFGKLLATGEYDAIFEANRARYEAKWGVTWEPHVTREAAAAEPA